MRHQQHRGVDLRKYRKLTRVKEPPKEPENLQELQRSKFLTVALPTTMTISPCVLLFRQVNASSRALLAKDVQEVSINATRRDATVQSHITFALTRTDMRWMQFQFHMVQVAR